MNKHIPLHQITELRTFLWITLFDKDIAPIKNTKSDERTPMFIPESRVDNISVCRDDKILERLIFLGSTLKYQINM